MLEKRNNFSGTFRTLSDIYDGAFLQKNDKHFLQKRYIIGVLQGSKSATRRMNKSVIILATSVNFPTQREHISHLVLVFLLLTLSR